MVELICIHDQTDFTSTKATLSYVYARSYFTRRVAQALLQLCVLRNQICTQVDGNQYYLCLHVLHLLDE